MVANPPARVRRSSWPAALGMSLLGLAAAALLLPDGADAANPASGQVGSDEGSRSRLGALGGTDDHDVLLNEVLGSTSGWPDSEYVELFGRPGASLGGLSLIVVEGEDPGQVGDISLRMDFGEDDRLGASGHFLIANEYAARQYGVLPDLPLDGMIENGSYTIALARTASLEGERITGREAVLDAVALLNPPDGRGDTFFFGAPVLGPDTSGHLPAGVGRVVDGQRTGAASDFRFLNFDAPVPPNTPTGAGRPDDVRLAGAWPDPVPMSVIQGAGGSSPMVGRQVVAEGIVVGDYQSGDDDPFRDLGGVFVMADRADFDDDDETSEGIFISDAAVPAALDLAQGDRVRVRGRVAEWFGRTTIEAAAIRVVARDAVTDIGAIAVRRGLPARKHRETLESMLVSFDAPLTLVESYGYEAAQEGVMAAGGPVHQFTQLHRPSAAGYKAYRRSVADRLILVDDGNDLLRRDFDPILAPDGTEIAPGGSFRLGQTYALTAIMDDAFGAYRLRLPEGQEFRPSPAVDPVSDAAPSIGGDYIVGSLNLLNYFTTLSGGTALGHAPRGADGAEEFDRQTRKIVALIEAMDADVLALSEIENDFGAGETAITTLVGALNDAAGRDRWAHVDPGRRFVGTDAIAVGFLYDRTTTRIAPGTRAAVLTDDGLPKFGADPGHPLFDGPGTSRAPLAASFEHLATGGRFTAAAVHLKSKGSISKFGRNADRGDGQGNNAEIRTRAAAATAEWLASDPTGAGDADRMILGDLNAYAREDPLELLASAGYVNLVERQLGLNVASYRYAGEVGTLDYALASPSLAAQVTGATVYNANSAEPEFFDYNLAGTRSEIARPMTQGLFDGDRPARASDHDPILVGLDLRGDALLLSRGDVTERLAAYAGRPVRRVREADIPDFGGELLVRQMRGARPDDRVDGARWVIERLRRESESADRPARGGAEPVY